jgi:sterol desaturase/sphingolipid hydroxylase (fatty acid hydroxylase superfamily)
MRLSKAGYYADFVVYPLLLLPLGGVLFWSGTRRQEMLWAAACVAGAAGFSLIEYLMHRFVLHRVAPFRGLHEMHHDSPTALVGTPTWLSAALIGGGVLLPLWWQAGPEIASGLSFGLIVGYLWYVSLHHAVHRWPARAGSYLHRAKRRHALHHHARLPCNFGVTTGCWDRLFGSAHALAAGSRNA